MGEGGGGGGGSGLILLVLPAFFPSLISSSLPKLVGAGGP